MQRDEVLRLLREHRGELDEFSVTAIAVFGSTAQGLARADSDVDLLVDFGRPVGLFHFVRLQRRLEEILGRRVDLVTRDALRPTMRAQVLTEAVVPEVVTSEETPCVR
ncbi:MAG: nucleotidyltransferase family protein [Anaerolineae bacterium]|nr:nucleotidyltransferase family protein [Anaerolineae bacterium]